MNEGIPFVEAKEDDVFDIRLLIVSGSDSFWQKPKYEEAQF